MKTTILAITIIFLLNVAGLRARGEAPTGTQTVRGTIVDDQTLMPIPGVTIVVTGSDPLLGTITNPDGVFRFTAIPVGRVGLKFSCVGYFEVSLPNIPVDAGKEVVLDIKMKESVNMLNEMVVTAGRQGDHEVANELATVSSRIFDREATQRYAGSRNDPARMASNFAGVSGANDGRNDIIIRGNSPTGLLWRLEGLDIPNPNHFAALGTTGGPVSILNNNLLGNSEFYTGAFPANYGNATSGVFDLSLRNGNNEKREYLAQIGFNGVEAGLEGPFKKGGQSSYLVNYRYSVPALIKSLNLNTGTGNAVPYYQDLSFKTNFIVPHGRLSLFGIGGKSHIDLIGSESDDEDAGGNLYNGYDMDIYNTSETCVAGLEYFRFIGKNSYWKNIIAASTTSFGADVDTVTRDENFKVASIDKFAKNKSTENKYSWVSTFHHRFSAKDMLETGVNIDIINANLLQAMYRTGTYDDLSINYPGTTALLQGYGSWQHRFSDTWTLNAGLHFMDLVLNSKSKAVEPRLGIRHYFTPTQSINLAYGRHNQLQPSTLYFIETRLPDGSRIMTNEQLGFTISDHLVLGYDNMLKSDLKLVVESYYQRLNNVPVEQSSSTFSILNAGADFGIPVVDSLVNKGKGWNMGVETTLEKYFNNSWYFLVTGSLFTSRYTASDEVERNTVFNGNYAVNALSGKEWKIGKKGNVIMADIKITSAGNKRYIPVDLEASRMKGETVYDYANAYSKRYPNYFRADAKITLRLQHKKLTEEYVIDVQNVTNHQNIFLERFNPVTGNLEKTYQLGIWPMLQYRIIF